MSTTQTLVGVHVEGGRATLTLNRPQRANALTPEMLTARYTASPTHLTSDVVGQLKTLASDPAVRVLVLTGAGRFFCTGMDLGGKNQAEMRARMAKGTVADEALVLYQSLKEFPKPVIARMNGSAMGGGLGLAMCADIRIGLSTSFFSFSEVKRGIVPAIISAYVVPEIGASNARRFFLTGEKIKAAVAKEVGILTEVASNVQELDALTDQYTRVFIENAPNAMSMVKRVVAYVDKHSHEENMDHVKGVFSKYVVTSPEAKYGMKCFKAKVKPDWSTLIPTPSASL